MRRIPHTMVTQHPDNAGAHPFNKKSFISAADEVEECFYAYSQLQCGEYMWDWEGKHVDEGVIDKLIEAHFEFFKQQQLGKDLFLTFRIPNIWVEKGYRIARAFASLIAANDLMEEMGLHSPPLFELILPMTTSAERLFFLRSKYSEIVKAFEITKEPGPKDISIIPLIEEPDLLFEADKLLDEYTELCNRSAFKKYELEYIRPFIARSDPALNAGLIPAVISAKAALSKFSEFSERTSIPTYPIIGVGCLPFRGHLSPESIRSFEREYRGIRTVTIQSAFRADYDETSVKKAIGDLKSNLSAKAAVYSADELQRMRQLNKIFTSHYQQTIEKLHDINDIAKYVPSRRERKLHIGLFGYSRKVGETHLPRAIPFTCALYSIGIPPEFIGTGRGLKSAEETGLLDSLQDVYVNLKEDLLAAGKYLNAENLDSLASTSKAWQQIQEDVALCSKLLELDLGPETHEQMIHRNLTSNIRLLLSQHKDITAELERAGEIRKSLG